MIKLKKNNLINNLSDYYFILLFIILFNQNNIYLIRFILKYSVIFFNNFNKSYNG